jgi:hypothetical protein
MATYDSLSVEQKTLVQNFMAMLRSWAGEQARTNNHGDATNTGYLAEAEDIIALLDAGAIIPNESGLDGAAGLSKEDVLAIVQHFQFILANYNTSALRQIWARAAGALNLIG